MQPMRLCICSGRQVEETFKKKHTNVTNATLHHRKRLSCQANHESERFCVSAGPGGDESFAKGQYCIYTETERSGTTNMKIPEVVTPLFGGQKSIELPNLRDRCGKAHLGQDRHHGQNIHHGQDGHHAQWAKIANFGSSRHP